jgi:site-specific recombinase XerD
VFTAPIRPSSRRRAAGGTPNKGDWQAALRRFQRFAKLVGCRVSLHHICRSLSTSLVPKGIPLDKPQVVLGHVDITTVRLYVQASGLEVAVEMAEWS